MQKSKLLDMAIAVVCAIALWLYVVTVVTPEDDLTINEIPVTFVGESELRSEYGLIISNRSDTTVTVKFHGSRAALRQLSNDRGNIVATLDVSGYTAEREYSATYNVTLPYSMQDNSVTVSDRSPRTIRFTVEKLQTKTIPVKGVFDGTTAEGFFADEPRFDQDMITVTGPADEVEPISYAQVVIGGDAVSETLEQREPFTLIDEAGEPVRSADLTTDSPDVGVTVRIFTTKEVPLTYTLLPGGGAEEEDAAVTLSPETVTLTGEAADLASVTEIGLGEIDLSDLKDGDTLTLPFTLPRKTSYNGALTARATVTFNELQTVVIPMPEPEITGLAEGMGAVVQSELPEVTLRGREIGDDPAVTAVIDLSPYSATGSYTVPVTVTPEDETLGAVGEYTVTVELS